MKTLRIEENASKKTSSQYYDEENSRSENPACWEIVGV